ncbi:TPA: translation initiation factor IF-2 subunit alpha [Candidatus Micrarchaeota archaeon]|nr:translation initiation factor IF-2 subunit alpha [Candidatus Micrarchaeota archaeon]
MIPIQELPDRNELVMATIRKIMPYGAFCILPEYNNLEAFLHVSEVAPRWIKNIHEFISEGQTHVMKVYRVDRDRNQFDVSIKRVSDEERRRKQEQVRTEKRAEKLLELSIKTSKASIKPEDATKIIEEQYGDVYSCFREAMETGDNALKDLDLPKALKTTIVEIAKKNIKKPTVVVTGTISLVCYGPDGVADLKKALEVSDKSVSILYLGAPSYKVTITAPDYKAAEKKLAKVVEQIKGFAQKNNCEFGFEREKA